METNTAIAIIAAVVFVFVLMIGVAKFQRWPEGRKRALRGRKRKGFLVK